MSLQSLDNLVKIGQLKIEARNQLEFIGLLRSEQVRLNDAMNSTHVIESRFDLAYNAAHALSLAALRWLGYRSGNRYVVFQALPHTLGLVQRFGEYYLSAMIAVNLQSTRDHDVDERLLIDLLSAVQAVLRHVSALDQNPKEK